MGYEGLEHFDEVKKISSDLLLFDEYYKNLSIVFFSNNVLIK